MEKYDLQDITGEKLRKHTLPNSWMFSPIVDLATQEVWTYLLQVPSFWGGDNKKLVAMYRNASENAAECPLVIDTSTSSCGNSRFGCWVCTVVAKDKSMENLIENGEDWMVPLLDFRDYLVTAREDYTTRMPYNRMNKDGSGPFKFNIRAEMLKRVLEIEGETGLEVISKQELAAIQLQWNYDGGFEFNVPDIYFSVKKKLLAMPHNNELEKREFEEFQILKDVAEENGVNPNHIRELLLTEKEYVTYLRRSNVFNEIQKKIERFVDRENLTTSNTE